MNDTVLDQQEVDMLDFSDVDMSDVEDLPDFITPPNGHYALAIPSARIDIIKPEDKPPFQAVKLVYQIVHVFETAGEVDVKVGSLFEETFMPKKKDDFSMKLLKKRLKSLMPEGTPANTPIPEQLDYIQQAYTGQVVTNAVVKVTSSTKDGKTYENTNVSQTYPLDVLYTLPDDVPYYVHKPKA